MIYSERVKTVYELRVNVLRGRGGLLSTVSHAFLSRRRGVYGKDELGPILWWILYRGVLKQGGGFILYAKGVIERGGVRRVFRVTGYIIYLKLIFYIIIISSFLCIMELCNDVLYYLYILRICSMRVF